MGDPKDVVLRPIGRDAANALMRRVHYSGKTVNNSQLHLGAFYQGRLEGVMQFGPPLDKRKVLPLVAATPWNGMLELNRLAFTDALPRNSESRALGVAMRLLRKHAPHVQWVLSFADGTQCGDGTIYRAAGFVLTGIKPNDQLWMLPGGRVLTRVSLTKGKAITGNGAASMAPFIAAGARPLAGYQLRYLYFLDPSARERLTVPVLPFSRISEAGAGMYLGQPIPGPASGESDTPAVQAGEGAAMRPQGSILAARVVA